jgi:hypothetical protein
MNFMLWFFIRLFKLWGGRESVNNKSDLFIYKKNI